MDYKSALKMLGSGLFGTEFTANSWSEKLLVSLGTFGGVPRIISKAPKLSTKRISSDLDRLFKMGFLNRKRVKRMVFARNSLRVNRGFMYVYSISKQGRQYLTFLARPKTDDGGVMFAEWSRDLLADDMLMGRPEKIAGQIKKHLLEMNHLGGRYNRFPNEKYSQLLYAYVMCLYKLRAKEQELERLKN